MKTNFKKNLFLLFLAFGSITSIHAQSSQTLTETLRVEYEYNASQQIYVSPEIWAAITRLKEWKHEQAN